MLGSTNGSCPLSQVVQALSALQDAEDRALLAANALSEAEGRQLSIATDAACSRALEALLPAAAPAAVASFARAMADPENYWELVSRCIESPQPTPPSLYASELHSEG